MSKTAPLIDIRPDHLAIVRDILKKRVPQYPVWAFGSRAKWTAKEYSDLDLAVITDRPLSLAQSAALADDFLESDLPWKVDVVDWSAIDPSFRKVIEKEYVVMQEGPAGAGGLHRGKGAVDGGGAGAAEWRKTTLDQVGRIVTGKTPPSNVAYYFGGDIPFVTPSDFDGRRLIASTNRYLTTEGANATGRSRIPAGAVMVSCIGSDMGKAAIAGRESVTNQQINSIVVGASDDPLFVYYDLSIRKAEIRASAAGSAQPILNKSAFGQMEILLPPIDEQRAIAGVLGALDDKIEQNRRTAQALERLARAIFRAWFVDFEPVKAKAEGRTAFPSMPQPVFDALPTRFVDSAIGPLPEGWEVKALSSVCTLVSGGTPKRSEATYWEGDVPWYSVKDAPSDGEVWVVNTSEQITEDGLANSAARVVPKGCTIISARGTVGKLAMAGVPMAFNQSCYGLMPGDGRSFCHLRLLMQIAVAELQQRTHGSVFDTITRATFDGLLVTIPPSEAVTSFESEVGPLFDLLLALLQESSKLAAMRDYLLPKLLSGQARVGEAASIAGRVL